jgi:sec-independent protein translocase protein TatA
MMGASSIWHWVIVLAIVMLLFGAGKIPRLMGDLAQGVKAFKRGLAEEDAVAASPAPAVEHKPVHEAT